MFILGKHTQNSNFKQILGVYDILLVYFEMLVVLQTWIAKGFIALF